MSNTRSQPLQPLNGGQLNTRSNLYSPLKTKQVKNAHIQLPAVAAPHQDGLKQPPKKKKEKLSALCKTPPSIVRTRNGRDYRRGNFLGEGGFARCFQMKDANGYIYAAKTVAKVSIKNEKTKTKLLSEIKIHKSLKHPNIVNFVDCFEDDVNVYILLEICPNQSLMELLKTRKRVSEAEVRYFMVQIVGAVKYLHSRRVIHRDLKLGNIFFDPEMNLKIGDFGLALVLPSTDSRKYTICGTPNYIAPEVLGGKQTGHSFEVDIWAIGIMMFALLVGKPPFQAKEVEVIYERIKKSEYSFPADKPISAEAQVMIKDILSLDPRSRPTIDEILNYEWFKGPFPDRTYEASLTKTPQGIEKITKAQSAVNFTTTKAAVGVYTSLSKNPVEILRSDLHSEEPKVMLPQSLSPNDTRNKYQEVEPALMAKPSRRINFNSKYSSAIRSLDQNCHDTLQNIRRLQQQCIDEADSDNGIDNDDGGDNDKNNIDENNEGSSGPVIENPTLISKWVDYSNKYGFSYQLNNDDIGVLFNDRSTVLKLHNSDRFLELIEQAGEGWQCIENSIKLPPTQVKRQLDIVDFFAKYMNTNLSKVSNNNDERKETVFMRRYTRTAEYIMFEMTNGNFQFNFKDHHKICISKAGLAITHVSPNRVTLTHPLIRVLKRGDFPALEFPNCLARIATIKEEIGKKASKASNKK